MVARTIDWELEREEDPPTAVAAYDDVEATVSARNAAVLAWIEYFEKLESISELVGRAREVIERACGGFGVSFGGDRDDDDLRAFSRAVSVPSRRRMIATAAQLVDSRMWSAVFDRSGLEYLMDAQAKAEWRAQLAFRAPSLDGVDTSDLEQLGGVPGRLPPFTADNVRASVQQWKDEAVDIFARGLANAFSALDSRFKSHDGFKIGSRVILDRLYVERGSDNYEMMDRFVDLERAFMVLDGVPKPDKDPWRGLSDAEVAAMPEKLRACYHRHPRDGWRFGLASVLRSRSSSPRRTEHESPYFLVRVFKNGNAHLWFKRPDLVAAVNSLLALYYGESLGYGRETYDEDGKEVEPAGGPIMALARSRPPAKNLGFYPTPAALVERVIEYADIKPGHRLLEPSAGLGALVWPAVKLGAVVTAVELDPGRASSLMDRSGPAADGGGLVFVWPGDFLSKENLGLFDRIVMNPPFDRGRDLDHVCHALRFLKPGGILVAIMSASARYGSGARHKALRTAVGDHPAEWYDLPPGSFKEAGTNVNSCLLRVGVRSWLNGEWS